MSFQTIICDEAHRLGNSRTQRYKAIRKLSEGSKHRYALTATPMMNRPGELWGVLNWIHQGCMGDWFSFTDRYTVKNQWGAVLFNRNIDELATRVKRYMFRRTFEEVAKDVPPVVIEDIAFDMSVKEKTLYDNLKRELLFEIEKNLIEKLENPMMIQRTLVKMLVLLELTCSLEILGSDRESTKLGVLKERLEDIFVDESMKVIIFTRFRKMSDILLRELARYRPLSITGEVKYEDREAARLSFQQDEDRKLIIMTDAGGEGLTLNRADLIFHYDLPYSYGKYEQRNGRARSLEKRKPVMIYHLLARKSMDMYLSKMLRSKAELSSQVLGDTPIGMGEIKQMLQYE
jgi:SNF2 family DNA or RNA helicase